MNKELYGPFAAAHAYLYAAVELVLKAATPGETDIKSPLNGKDFSNPEDVAFVVNHLRTQGNIQVTLSHRLNGPCTLTLALPNFKVTVEGLWHDRHTGKIYEGAWRAEVFAGDKAGKYDLLVQLRTEVRGEATLRRVKVLAPHAIEMDDDYTEEELVGARDLLQLLNENGYLRAAAEAMYALAKDVYATKPAPDAATDKTPILTDRPSKGFIRLGKIVVK